VELNALLVDVVLIHLIGNDQNIVLVANVNNLLNVALRENLASGVSRIDHNDASNVNACLLCISDLLLHIAGVK